MDFTPEMEACLRENLNLSRKVKRIEDDMR